MFSFPDTPPTTTAVFSAFTSVMASIMLIRTLIDEAISISSKMIPPQLRKFLLSKLGLLGRTSTSAADFTLVINEGSRSNQENDMYEASKVYLRTKINSPSLQRLAVSKQHREKNLTVSIEKDQHIVDVFEGIRLKWKLTCTSNGSKSNGAMEDKFFELTFHRKFKETVLGSYLPYILTTSKDIIRENMVIKLHGDGRSIDLHHPATFETLAMDISIKNELLEDLDRFVKRKDFYKRVGKAWKRGYLLYGPPGTGKSSLIGAMANYLNFNVYDLELARVYNNSELRRILVGTKNRSILVIEDIDCSVNLKNRTSDEGSSRGDTRGLTLSGILNFMDGLWSSCGDERIIVVTTNYKDKLDPALLRPGRMDMHIHMSYCTPCAFKQLAFNYLQIKSHPLFEEIESLIQEVNVTPAEIAEQLMRSEDCETCLQGLINFIQTKKTQQKAS